MPPAPANAGGTAAPPAPPLAPPAPPPNWDTVLHLVLPHLQHQPDRSAVRAVCRDWRTAADAAWQAGMLNCGLCADAAAGLASGSTFLLPRLNTLVLAELQSSKQLQEVLQQQLTAHVLPALRHLSLSAAVGVTAPLADGGALATLALPSLNHLELQDITLQGGMASLTHLRNLTELTLGLLTSGAAAGGGAGSRAVAGVHHLTSFGRLQALALPELHEQEREALSRLTNLTRLAFTAAGQGAVGPSLARLPRLCHLTISLSHTHNLFIVLHPRVDWAALRLLPVLRQLSICHLAAFSFFPLGPELTWSQEEAVAQEVEALLACLPCIQALELRLSFCRVQEEDISEEGREVIITGPDADPHAQNAHSHPRLFLRTLERVPVRPPGARRSDAWYHAWWQPTMEWQLEAASCRAGGSGTGATGVAVAAGEELERRRQDACEMEGWTAIRPGACRTHDTLVMYTLLAGSSDSGSSSSSGSSGSES